MQKVVILILTICFFSRMTHGDIAWSTPSVISTALTNASAPCVVIDSNGNATTAWVEMGAIKACSLPAGGNWTAPVTLSNILNTASTPILGVDSSGNVTALWIENTQIKSAMLLFGGSWITGILPLSNTGASNPALAVDASGNAVAVWVRNGYVESSTRILGIWSLFTVISTANSNHPDVAISSTGIAIAAWQSMVSGSVVIVTDILTIGSNKWAATKNVFNGTAALLHNYPKIAVDAYGNASVAWFRYNLVNGISYQKVKVLASSLSAGGSSWTAPTVLSNSGMRNPADLKIELGFDESGNALAVWTNSYDGLTFSVESALQKFGSAWSSSIMPHVPSLYTCGIDVAIASDIALLTQMTWDGVSAITIQSQETNTAIPVGQDWTHTNAVSTGTNNAYPHCAFSLTGGTCNAVVVWVYFDGTNNVIQASSGQGSTILPPSNVSATQGVKDMGVYKEYFNTITWNASSDPNLMQYNIFRNGVFFAATDPSHLLYIDHNAVQGGTVTYGVAAHSAGFRQSEIVSFTLNP